MRMVKNNIERIAETLDAVECLKAKGCPYSAAFIRHGQRQNDC